MKKGPRFKIIIDTNIWISYLIGFQVSGLTELLCSRKIELVLCDQLMMELTEVTARKKFHKYFGKKEVKDLLELMKLLGTHYKVSEYPRIGRDAKDNFLLGLIQVSKANYLVTGDQDLLELNPFEGTEIIEANQLLNKIEASS